MAAFPRSDHVLDFAKMVKKSKIYFCKNLEHGDKGITFI